MRSILAGDATELSPEQIRQLGTAIRESFPLTPDCEITLEGRIHRFSDEMFENALEGGFNRFSFGVQSFNTQVRRRAKRLDDREVVMERIASLAATQQAPIVIDLLYGLPYQTAQVFEQDLQDFMQTGHKGLIYTSSLLAVVPRCSIWLKKASYPHRQLRQIKPPCTKSGWNLWRSIICAH